MSITHVETSLYRLPLPFAMQDSMHGVMTHSEFVVVRLRDGDGVEGVGYTYALNSGKGIAALIEGELGPFLRGRDADLIEALWKDMWWHVHYAGRGGSASFAISAVDIALWDLKARKLGVPLWRLLGGHNPDVHAYAGSINFNFSIPELIQQNRQLVDNGFHAVKMRVGKETLREDIERVGAVRKEIGPDVHLMVDANMKWSAEEAIRRSRALAEHDVYWLEEPTIPDDVAGHARIVAEGLTPVAAGENLHTIYEFQKFMAANAVSFVEPDVTNCGGITPWMKVAHMAEAYNLPVTSHGVHDLHVHLLAAIPNANYLEIHGFGVEPYVEVPLPIVNGMARAPERPGHSVDFDWEKLEPYRLG